MAQYPPAIAPVNASALQEPISLQCAGNLITVGAPGSPVAFSAYGAPILTVLAGSIARSATSGHI